MRVIAGAAYDFPHLIADHCHYRVVGQQAAAGTVIVDDVT
jgi:hypothetical protein